MAKKKSTKARSTSVREVPSHSAATTDFSAPHISMRRFNFFSDRKIIFIYLLLFALVAGVFWSATRNDFFYWYGDDTGYVTENAHVKSGLTLESVKWAFS